VNELLRIHSAEIKSLLGKYPRGQERSAVMPLLHLVQRDNGCITRHDIDNIAGILGISTTEITSIVGFYTLFHPEEEKTRYRIQVCTDLACALCGADDFLEKLCHNVGIKPGETTPDGMVTIEEVTCLAGCDKAPLFQVQGGGAISYHENQTPESAVELINRLRNSSSGAENE
jgi:NADH-quinone oxidoreductase subunit E